MLSQDRYPVRVGSMQLGSSTNLSTVGFCALVERDTLLGEIMQSVEDLVAASSQHVRAALGSQISGLAPILGKEE